MIQINRVRWQLTKKTLEMNSPESSVLMAGRLRTASPPIQAGRGFALLDRLLGSELYAKVDVFFVDGGFESDSDCGIAPCSPGVADPD